MYQIRELEGRAHYVVPTVLIVEGIWAGTGGPVYYAAPVLAESARAWNGRPVVVYHPSMAAGGYADHPEIYNRQKVGVLFNCRFDGRRLLADAWIDAERVGHVDYRVKDAILNRRVSEVSTGVAFEAAVPDGYGPIVAGRLYPDHLAILPDTVGACPVAAGAGLMRNEAYGYALAY